MNTCSYFTQEQLTFSTPRNTDATKENQNSSHKPFFSLCTWRTERFLLFSEGGGFLCVSLVLWGSPPILTPPAAAFLYLEHLWINKGSVSPGRAIHIFFLTESGHLFLLSGRRYLRRRQKLTWRDGVLNFQLPFVMLTLSYFSHLPPTFLPFVFWKAVFCVYDVWLRAFGAQTLSGKKLSW